MIPTSEFLKTKQVLLTMLYGSRSHLPHSSQLLPPSFSFITEDPSFLCSRLLGINTKLRAHPPFADKGLYASILLILQG